MKHILYTLFLSIIFLTVKAQTASVLLSTQSTARDTSVRNVVFIGSGSRIWVAKVDSLKMYPYNMTWLKDSTLNWGDVRYPQLSTAYSNPNFVNTLSAAKVFGLSNVATTGNYNDLTNLPNLNLFYPASNPNGYITGVTSGDVITALGGTPLFSEVDGSINNELQTIGIVNRIITLSNAGGTVTIPYQSFDSLTNKPTTLSGFGITDGVTSSSLASTLSGYATITALNTKMNYSDTVSLSNRINTKQNQLSGNGLVRMTGATVSYDNNTYLTAITSGQVTSALGYTPVTNARTITINGSTQDLSVNRTWTIPTTDTISLSNRINLKLNSSDTTSLSTRINTKVDQAGARTAISLTTTGSGAASYNSGTGVINVPTSKRQETYAGTSDASGNYTITFPSAYAIVPNVQASITNQSNSQQFIMVTSATTTGCTIKVVQRNASFLSLLGLDVLTTGVTNVNGASVAVLVTER